MTAPAEMVGSIPPTEHFSHLSSTEPNLMDDLSSTSSTGSGIMTGTTSYQESSNSSLFVGVIGAIGFIVFGLWATSQGAPVFFLLFAILGAFASIAMSIAKDREVTRLAEQKAAAAMEADQQLKSEIAQAVKESMKGTIKVRCKYCGSLNDEKASKCDSCGATL